MSVAAYEVKSPYAKPGVGDQLTCTLCNSTVKSAKVWVAHVNGRQHRENLLALKSGTKPQNSQPSVAKPATNAVDNRKRVAESQLSHVQKKSKVSEDGPSDRSLSNGVKSTTKVAEYMDVESSSSEDDNDIGAGASNSTALPADFFDNPSTMDTSEAPQSDDDETNDDANPEDATETAKTGEVPEGFFDDKHMDAKVRKVEFKDPLDDEWNQFQKEIKKVDTVSEQIIVEDEDKTAIEVELEENEGLLNSWSRLHELEVKRNPSNIEEPNGSEPEEMNSESLTEDDDISLENLLDWRSKNFLK